MSKIDLHTHSTSSDGTASPSEVVARAEKAGVTLLALSDHDSVSGLPEAAAAAAGREMRFCGGVEINTCCGENVHILGYGMRWEAPALRDRLAEFRARRVRRVEMMLAALAGLGVELPLDEVRQAGSESLGRAHVADALRRRGVVPNRAEAFRRFLGQGRPAYVPSLGPSPEEAIALIRSAGGFAVVAHPGTLPDPAVIPRWVESGLEGLEVHYSTHSPSDVVRFQGLADRFDLVVTGGSDYHGPRSGRDGPLGVAVSDAVDARFLERLAKCG